jgi:hypothetical protein
MSAARRKIFPELKVILTPFITGFYLPPLSSRWQFCVALSAKLERRNLDLHLAPPAAEALLPWFVQFVQCGSEVFSVDRFVDLSRRLRIILTKIDLAEDHAVRCVQKG